MFACGTNGGRGMFLETVYCELFEFYIIMDSVRIISPGRVELAEVDMPLLRPGFILLKVRFVGFCGSDLNTFKGLNPLVRLPIVPGHEIGAVIEAVADDVPAHLQAGMSVTVNPYTECGFCPACQNGRPNACEWNETLGVQRNGAMQEFILVPWVKVIPDASLSVRELALVEPLSVGFHAINRANITQQDTVLVIGCGMIGIGAIIHAVNRGARVIVADVDDNKLQLAKQLWAVYGINTLKENLHERVGEITEKRGADVVVEAVGCPETYLSAIAEVAFTGRVAFIGYAKEKVPFDTSQFVKKELNIMGSRNAMPHDMKEVIEYLKQGICPVDELVSAVYKPEEAQIALEKWDENPGNFFRILIQF